MKLQSCAMIKCIALNSMDTEKLTAVLNKHILKYLPAAKIFLYTNTPYWKYPEENVLIYNVSNAEFILVANIIKMFHISWNYTKEEVYDIDIQKSVNLEEAIWSKNTHPEEKFLMTEVQWVHIHTWKDSNESIIN